jgi:fatty acid desaturase
VDWLDWIVPEAWEYEHVLQHHNHVGERQDPDLVERNLTLVRKSRMPVALRFVVVGAYMLTWRLTYYAPNTLMILQNARLAGRRGQTDDGAGNREYREFWRLWNPFSRRGAEFWRRCVLPYGIYRFVLIPAAFLLVSPAAAVNVLLTSLLAETLTNVHSFVVIGPNHTGDDLYRFDTPGRGGAEYHLRQVLGTANFTTGRALGDFLQGWLNYQIEHHLWQDLPMSAYSKLQPKVQNLCAQMRIPYVQESVWKRLRKTLDIMVGRTSMKRTSVLVTASDH